MTGFKPYENETQAAAVGGLSIENRVDAVAVFGSVDLTRDKKGLVMARRLKAVLDATVAALESDPALPDEVAPPDPGITKRDPFAG
jgi:hypothetical protein